MKVYDFDSYKEFLNSWIKNQVKGGHGLLSKMAKTLDVHTTLLSHTIRGEKQINLEQAYKLAQFIDLNENESDYFLLLVQIERAGTVELKDKFKIDLEKIKKSGRELKRRLKSDKQLNKEEAAQFYSSWIYSAVRQMSSIKEFQHPTQMQQILPISNSEFQRVVDFLVETGLCAMKNDRMQIGPNKTHLPANSPHIYNHHRNWRIKGLERHHQMSANELIYSAPFTISQDDFLIFREKVVRLIEELVNTCENTQPEKLSCFNIDLFDVLLK